MHDLRLAHALHVFGASRDHVLVRAYRREAVSHAGLAQKAFKERILKIRVYFQASFHELPDVHIMAPSHIALISCNFKYGTMGLAKATAVTLGNFIIDGLQWLIHGIPQVFFS
jgi:hypothetical protein